MLGACAFALIFTLFGGLNAHTRTAGDRKMPAVKRAELAMRAMLSVVGLLLWSLVIPGSTTQQAGWALRNADAWPIIVPLAAIAFGLIAEWLVTGRRLRWLRRWFS